MSETIDPHLPLDFDHLGEFEVGDQAVICDATYLGPQFQGMAASGDGPRRRLQMMADIEPGTWHAMVGMGPSEEPVLLLVCHQSELARDDVLEHAEAVGIVQIDSGRLVIGHAGLRDDPQLLTVLPTLSPEDFPGIVLDGGAAVDGLERGYYTLLGSTERPRTVLFVVLAPG